jgi:hypothetical protein
MTYRQLRLLFAGLARYDGRLSVLTARNDAPVELWTVMLRGHVRHSWLGIRRGTQAEWQGTLVYAIPSEVVRRTRRGSLRLPVEAMAARAAWLVGELSQHDG